MNYMFNGLMHTFSITVITTIDMFTIDDKACLYLEKKRCNIVLIGFMAIHSSISIDIMHVSITYQ